MKFIWMLRAITYKLFFGSFGLISYIGQPIYISGVKNIFFGKRVRIYPHSRIESLGGKIQIGDNVSIGQNLHLICKLNVFIGDKTTISANVFISDVDHEYVNINVHIMEQVLNSKETVIGENCFIGYGCVILPGTILGKQCIVGANSVVKGVFPDYCVVAGSPARIIKRYDPIDALWKKTDILGNFFI
ncbi:acyltransferase [Shewanella sp. SM73]|uniref:acyltransferase n=1 Tax=Shewanella sp. SM73 TaxID=2912806 RepID=UPI0021D7DE6E|nr:acyltransferase [Shewanella sp. SM73]MCU8031124.1 acyltransferase [Shewanella sp. SM73]